MSALLMHAQTGYNDFTYPMTPIDALIRDSLRFMSLAMTLSSSKIDWTYCCRAWAAEHGRISLSLLQVVCSNDLLLSLAFIAPMMPPQASIMPSRSEIT